jgi:endonuclease-3
MPVPRRSAPRPKSASDTRRIMARLSSAYPGADTELHFTTPYELLVATILSAQCTDERVNQVTPALFERYPDATALARASTSELEPQIQSTGFFRAKSRSLVGMAAAVVDRHQGEIPNTMDELVHLPGVGRKTANVVLGHALGVPGLPVDRHVLRVANRIGIASSEDPEVVEQQLCAALPPDRWTVTSDTLILHGRRICKPRPQCDRCVIRDDCDYYKTASSFPLPASSTKGAARRAAKAGATGGGAASASREASREAGASRAKTASSFPLPASSMKSAARRAAKPGSPGGGGQPTERPESGSVSGVRRAAKPRGTGRGGAPTERSESGSLMEPRRAAKPRGTGRSRAPQERSESGSLVEERRGPEARGTGRGGGAPRQTK